MPPIPPIPPPPPPGMGGGDFLRYLGDHRLRGDEEAGHGSGSLQGLSHHFRGVDDALRDHVHVLAVLGVEAVAVLVLLKDLADHDRAVLAGIGGDLAGWSLDGFAHDLHAGLLVVVLRPEPA